MKFTIYGSGCAKCKQLTANAESAAQALGKTYEVEKVTDTNAIIDAGIMRTPALAVDGDIIIEGKVLNPDTIRELLDDGS
ncbi:thioredoxin family protein [Haliea sp. E17]|uniref:thioredoxin family protein n=1 Tax=Haliea sp. E17 TaxID=3401576 RepID=UPI003AAD0F37